MLRALCLAVILIAGPVYSQQTLQIQVDPKVEAVFQSGVILYNNGNYSEARRVFSQLTAKGQHHQLLTAALIMHAKCSYWLRDYKTAQDDIKRMLRINPKTRYLDHARLLMGLIHFQRQDAFNAAKQFLWATDFAKVEKIREKSFALARIIVNDYLTSAELMRLRREADVGARGSALLTLALAQKNLQKGKIEQAQNLVVTFLDEQPQNPMAAEMRDFLTTHIEKKLRMQRIGVILPLTGDFMEEGTKVWQGIKFAEMEARQKSDGLAEIEIDIRDSQSNVIKAIAEMQALIKDPRVVCVIGELENVTTAALAGVAQVAEMPFVAPSATDNGVAALGDYVFQASPDLETQARALARYAFNVDSLRTFITIAPQSDYGRDMVDAFSEEIDKLGGEIITQRWYYGVPENLGRQFKEIREIAFRRELEQSTRLQVPNFAHINKDSLWRDFNYRFMQDNDEDKPIVELHGAYPVTNIDGVFLPIYQEDIRYVARQLKYFNIQAQVLGGGEWYFDDLSKEKQLLSYVNEAIFASSYYYDPKSFEFRAFTNKFRHAMKSTPEKWHLFGYDTANMILSILDGNRVSRSQLRNVLASYSMNFGKKGAIKFTPETRVNQAVQILQIRRGKIVRLATGEVD